MELNSHPETQSGLPGVVVTVVRPAGTGDSSAWLRLRAALWPEAANAKEITRSFTHPTPGVTLLAEIEDDRIVGFAEVSVRRDWVEGCTTSPVAYLEGLFVEPAFRRRGVARQLIAAVERWAKAEGLTELGSDTEIGNTASECLHGACGFREVERCIAFVKVVGE